MDHFHLDEDSALLREMIVETLDVQDESYPFNPMIVELVAKVDTDLFLQIHAADGGSPMYKHRALKLWYRIVAVAAVAALVFFGVHFFKTNDETGIQPIRLTAKEIVPGSVGATLTLADGKTIELSDAVNGELARESGVVITKTSDGSLVYEIEQSSVELDRLNTLSTAKGQTYQVRLPDGSLVYLNAASSLTYKTSLIENGKRIVSLQGEGYFEIVKDKTHPFVVKTDNQEVEVLGTHFNISSYQDDAVEKTTLLEGSVKLSAFGNFRILKPGQQAKLIDGKMSVEETDTDLAIAWKDNKFVFESEPIERVMKLVERWYNVEVVYVGDKTLEKFTGNISRFDNISKVLQIVELTGTAHFKIEGRKIYVSK